MTLKSLNKIQIYEKSVYSTPRIWNLKINVIVDFQAELYYFIIVHCWEFVSGEFTSMK